MMMIFGDIRAVRLLLLAREVRKSHIEIFYILSNFLLFFLRRRRRNEFEITIRVDYSEREYDLSGFPEKKGPILLMSLASVSFKIFLPPLYRYMYECEMYVDPNYIIMQSWHIVVVVARVEVYEVNQLA